MLVSALPGSVRLPRRVTTRGAIVRPGRGFESASQCQDPGHSRAEGVAALATDLPEHQRKRVIALRGGQAKPLHSKRLERHTRQRPCQEIDAKFLVPIAGVEGHPA